MKKIAINLLALIFFFILAITSCTKDPAVNNPGGDPTGATFREVIETGGNIGDPITNRNTDTTDVQENLPIGEGTYSCTTVTHNVNAASGGSTGFPLFNPTAGIIYPGNMLQGDTLNDDIIKEIVVERAGGTISTDVLDGNLTSTFTVDKVKQSTIINAMNNILADAPDELPSNFNIQIASVQSSEEFALALGVDVNTTFSTIESKLNYKSSTDKSSFLVSLNQSYYTMSFDLPTSLDQLFDSSVSPEDLALYVGENNPATYISSVTYGRIFYMLIESTSTQSELEVAVDAAFRGVTVDVDASLDLNHFSSLDNVTYSVYAYGGDAETTFQAIGETDMNTLKDVLSQSSTLESGKPLSFVVRNVSDNQIVSTQLATEYSVVECEQTSSEGTLPAIAHWTNHPLLDDFGPITAAYADNNEKFFLINQQGKWLRSTINDEGEGILEGPFPWGGGDLPFSSIGATARLRGPGEKLYVFNGLGNKYAVWDLSLIHI